MINIETSLGSTLYFEISSSDLAIQVSFKNIRPSSFVCQESIIQVKSQSSTLYFCCRLWAKSRALSLYLILSGSSHSVNLSWYLIARSNFCWENLPSLSTQAFTMPAILPASNLCSTIKDFAFEYKSSLKPVNLMLPSTEVFVLQAFKTFAMSSFSSPSFSNSNAFCQVVSTISPSTLQASRTPICP